MKKSMASALAALFVAGIAGTAFAGPFADVPAKHWSYDAVNKLAAAGIVDGYGDGTFKGDKTMTRYEMAQIVGKAMERSDKADAEQKALIKKLSDEYADELGSLGVRVAALENKVGNVKWTGQVREWYQNIDEPKARLGETRVLLWTNAQLTKDLAFTGRFSALSNWGSTTSVVATGDGVGAEVSMDNAYLSGKNFTLGRQPITLGKGLVYNIGYNNDGATYTVGNDKAKLTAAAFKGFAAGGANILAANAAVKVSDDLDLTGVYAKNTSSSPDTIDTWAVGFGYKGIQDVTLTGEYGENSAAADTAKAWVAQAKVKGADWNKAHTYGLWVGYRDADNGFNGVTGDPIWETPYGISPMNNIKGADYGFEYTVFKNAVATVNYLDLEDQAGVDKKSYTAQLRYFF